MRTTIILGQGTICITSGLFENTETKEQYVGIRFSPLKKQLEVGEPITDNELIDNRYETMIKLDNWSGIHSLEKAVARARIEMGLKDAKKSETIHQAAEQTETPAEPEEDSRIDFSDRRLDSRHRL